MDLKQTDKVDVFHWPQIHLQPMNLQDAQTVLFQTETEDVSHQLLKKLPNAPLATWVTETETASQYHHQWPQSHHHLQVLAHAKVQLMNYNQKYQFYKQLLHSSHYQLLNHKLPLDHQIQHPVLQVETRISKLKLKYMPKSLFNLKEKEKTHWKTKTKNEWAIDLLIYCIMRFCLGNTKQNRILKIIFYKSLILKLILLFIYIQ